MGQGGSGIFGSNVGAGGETIESSSWEPWQSNLGQDIGGWFAQNFLGQSGQGNSPFMMNTNPFSGDPAGDYSPEAFENLYQYGVENPALSNLSDITIPALRERMGRKYFSTPAVGMEQKATQDVMSGLMGTRAKMGMDWQKTKWGAQEAARLYAQQAAQQAAMQNVHTGLGLGNMLLGNQPIQNAYMPSSGAFGLGILGL